MENETQTALIILCGSLTLAFLVMLIYLIATKSRRVLLENMNKLQSIEQQKQVDLFRAATEAEENQKVKIAANLHDQIIPNLRLKISGLLQSIDELENKGVNTGNLKDEVQSLNSLSDSIREVAHDLIPKLFNSFGLLKSIEVFVKDINEAGPFAAEFHNNTTFSGSLPFSINDQLIIYRMSMEIMNNLIKHSNFDYLNVTLENVSDQFELVFAHDGAGISNEEINLAKQSGKGLGLRSLQSRAMILNATIDYYKDKGVSHVKLIVPIKK